MALPSDVARTRFASAPVARLATVDERGWPHLVPITFGVADRRIVTAVDRKPKRGHDLKRLRNIARNPNVSVLVDHYTDDWQALWWVRADGVARVVSTEADHRRALALLVEKYPQYRQAPPDGPVVEISVTRWNHWAPDWRAH